MRAELFVTLNYTCMSRPIRAALLVTPNYPSTSSPFRGALFKHKACVIEKIKVDSSKWINKHGYVKYQFHCQGGYGAFSYTKSDIQNPKEHHKKISFVEEYQKFL